VFSDNFASAQSKEFVTIFIATADAANPRQLPCSFRILHVWLVDQFEFALKGRGFRRAVSRAQSIAAPAAEECGFSN